MMSTRQLGMALSKARHEKVWKPAIAATWLMIRRDGDAAKCWAGDDLKSICHDELHNWPIPDWRIAPALVGTGLRLDPVPAEERRSGVRQSIRRDTHRRLSEENVVEDRQVG